MSDSIQVEILEIHPEEPIFMNSAGSGKIWKDEDQELDISVSCKTGEEMSAYDVYKVTTKTKLSHFRNNSFSVSRRSSDFLDLHEKLVKSHPNFGRIAPPASEEKTTKEESLPSEDLIEKRRASLERYLNTTASHPVLRMDRDFRNFLEAEFDPPKVTNSSVLSTALLFRLFNRVEDTLNEMTSRMDETYTWFEEKQNQIENLQQQLKKFHSSVKTLAHLRKELTMLADAFPKSAALLANCKEFTALSGAVCQKSEVQEKKEQIQIRQVNNDFYLLTKTLKDYLSLISTVRETFHQRIEVYKARLNVQQVLIRKRVQKTANGEKLREISEEIEELKGNAQKAQEQFRNISNTFRKEVERFEQTRVQEFNAVMVKYRGQLLEAQKRVAEFWESFLLETNAIA